MSEYCCEKVIRMKISEEEACEIFGVEDGLGIAECLEGTHFKIAPTSDFFLDYVLSSSKGAEGEWGRSRGLSQIEFLKYAPDFCNLLKPRGINMNELRLVEYCYYNGSEAPDYFDESTYHDDFYDEV